MRRDPSPDSTDMSKLLLAWFLDNQRSLPWRDDPSPYAVWISEIMLQQTQVVKVVPYFEKWMARLPDPESVARAEEETLLRLWEGLGYYSRVRNLQKAAQKIVRDHAGTLPRDEKALLKLPGIGPYTAAAILSLAYNIDVPVVDGNAERVAARLLDLDQPVKAPSTHRIIREKLKVWLPKGHARNFNQAVMELGATVCTPALPACGTCPVSSWCLALKNNTVLERPVKVPRPSTVSLIASVGILRDTDGLVYIQKRPPDGLMANLWEFPGGILKSKEYPEDALRRAMLEELGVKVRIGGKLGKVRHAYTRYRVWLHVFRCELEPPAQEITPQTAVEGRWTHMDELYRFAFPSAHRRIIDKLL